MVHAFGGHITQWNTRLVGFACLIIIIGIHIFHLNLGLRIQNVLAIVKIGILLFVILSGVFVSIGSIPLKRQPHNFDKIWDGTTNDPNAFVAALYNVLW